MEICGIYIELHEHAEYICPVFYNVCRHESSVVEFE